MNGNRSPVQHVVWWTQINRPESDAWKVRRRGISKSISNVICNGERRTTTQPHVRYSKKERNVYTWHIWGRCSVTMVARCWKRGRRMGRRSLFFSFYFSAFSSLFLSSFWPFNLSDLWLFYRLRRSWYPLVKKKCLNKQPLFIFLVPTKWTTRVWCIYSSDFSSELIRGKPLGTLSKNSSADRFIFRTVAHARCRQRCGVNAQYPSEL